MKVLKNERDSFLSEIQILKSKDTGSADPSDIMSLKKRILKLESDLKDKTSLASNLNTELDQLKTVMEELKRRASVRVFNSDL